MGPLARKNLAHGGLPGSPHFPETAGVGDAFPEITAGSATSVARGFLDHVREDDWMMVGGKY